MKAESGVHLHRIVLDTNVWISAALSASGTAALVTKIVLAKRRPVFSEATFTELETRLWKPKFDRYLNIERRQRILHDLGSSADWVRIPDELAAQSWSRDPDDDHFVRAALAARAPWLITGDTDLLDIPTIDGLRILTPAQALRAWNE